MKNSNVATEGEADAFLSAGREALQTVERLFAGARQGVRARVSIAGNLDPDLLEEHQHPVHGLAWYKTYILALDAVIAYAQDARLRERLTLAHELTARIAVGEILCQLFSGIAMSQSETARLFQFNLIETDGEVAPTATIANLILAGNNVGHRKRLMDIFREEGLPDQSDAGSGDDFALLASHIRDFVDAEIIPAAQKWHLENAYIPLEVVANLGKLGVFGVSVPEEYGGMGLGKCAMCAVTEELSRGFLGVGSLGTRSEIAAELILQAGTRRQKEKYLRGIASGEILTTAVFTEPGSGSDLANVETRAVRHGDVYKIHGAKTWITHAARADVMVLLARTDAQKTGYRGLSIFLIDKLRGSQKEPFPAPGISGGEIEVIGYRGMKEFEIAFDGFEVPASSLLGAIEGKGFKQLMRTFESARIQTAARSVGVIVSAMELSMSYANLRQQFGKAILQFPRIADKIVAMAVDAHIARQLTLSAARRKDAGIRCDLEAGAAKLFAARAAWAAADNAVQIHGGNGYALEFPASRLLCDARILNIFEGTAEIQAQVIGRGLLEER